MNINDLHLSELRRFAELGRLSATLIHEISNPLSAAILNLELSDSTSPAIRQAHRNMQVLRRYVEAARQQFKSSPVISRFTLAPQINLVKRVVMPLAKPASVQLDIGQVPRHIRLQGDPVKFQQILTNLVVNAIQAYEGCQKGGRRLVRLGFEITADSLIVTVTDWGQGIAAADQDEIFKPLYTTKQSGLGLGLAIVKQYVTNDFKGHIRVRSSPTAGTRFTIQFPLPPKRLC